MGTRFSGACAFRDGCKVLFSAAATGWGCGVDASAVWVPCRFINDWTEPGALGDVNDPAGFGCAF